MAKPLFINENTKVDNVIKKMQKEKKHLAVVVDEYGGTSGVVSLEDAIEQLFGEIYDEHDEEVPEIELIKNEDGTYTVNAEMEIEELFETLEIEKLPESQYNSVGGFLFELAQSMPQKGQQLEFVTIDERIDENANLVNKTIKMEFVLTKVEDNRIREAQLTVTDL